MLLQQKDLWNYSFQCPNADLELMLDNILLGIHVQVQLRALIIRYSAKTKKGRIQGKQH